MSENEYKEIFAKNLKHYMDLNDKTQTDLINDLGLSSSTVSNWCTGLKLPRMNKIEMLANYFGINKSDLIEEKKDEKQTILSKLPEFVENAIEARKVAAMLPSFGSEGKTTDMLDDNEIVVYINDILDYIKFKQSKLK